MRAPPESLRPSTGTPILSASSISLTILAACVAPSAPPNTVKSWAKMHTARPSMRACPGMTPSPRMACSAVRVDTASGGHHRLFDAEHEAALGVTLDFDAGRERPDQPITQQN